MLNHAHITPVIPVADLERARRYYAEILGLSEEGRHGENIAFGAADGERLELILRPDAVAKDATVLTFEVEDVEAEVQELRERGVTFEPVDLPGATRAGVITTLEGERAAWLKDSEGNWLCLHEAGDIDIEDAEKDEMRGTLEDAET